MQLPFGPWPGLIVIALIVFATLHDLALLAGRALSPWFGWMFP